MPVVMDAPQSPDLDRRADRPHSSGAITSAGQKPTHWLI